MLRSILTEGDAAMNTTLRSSRGNTTFWSTSRLVSWPLHLFLNTKAGGCQAGGRECSLLVWLRTRPKEMTNCRILFLCCTTLRIRRIRLTIKRRLNYRLSQRPIHRQRRRGTRKAGTSFRNKPKGRRHNLARVPISPNSRKQNPR